MNVKIVKKQQLVYVESDENYGWLSIVDWKDIDNTNIGRLQSYNTELINNIDKITIDLIKNNLENYKEIYILKVPKDNLNLYLNSGFEHVETLDLYENTSMNYNIIESNFNIIDSELSHLNEIIRVDNLAFEDIWKESRDTLKNAIS
ncbi:MAG: hypothetical protein ACRDDM_04920, partial [Paraclostridium sp.]